MTGSLPPGVLLILGALVVPFLLPRARPWALVVLPVVSFVQMLSLPHGTLLQVHAFDCTLTLVRVDALSLAFGWIFHIAAFTGGLFALHSEDRLEQSATLAYVGAAIAGLFAGDLVTLFVGWELTAISSVFIIWARRTPRAFKAGLRYLVVQVASGVILLAGVAVHYRHTGSIEFGRLGLADPGTILIFIAFGIKCAFPLLHNWLQDAYPESTVTGTVFLSVFTTKLAVYALARGFPGTELLVPIGAAMTAFPIFYAVIENDLRRVLTYSLNNQLGFMVVGIGIGTPLALNGAVAYAFCNILFESLLFMSMGAVLLRTGKINGTDLGGLYKSMPWTAGLCIVGAASISAFPFLNGFVSKSLILQSAVDGHWTATWFVLLFASAGVFHHSGIKIPFFAFFSHDSGIRCKEAPGHMLAAMGLTAALCIGIGLDPGRLYGLLPHPVEYRPYTLPHMVAQWQLLFFSGLAFAFLKRTGIYPPELRSTNLDSDWFYRRVPKAVWNAVLVPLGGAWIGLRDGVVQDVRKAFSDLKGGRDRLREPWPLSWTVIVVCLALFVYLVVSYGKAGR